MALLLVGSYLKPITATASGYISNHLPGTIRTPAATAPRNSG